VHLSSLCFKLFLGLWLRRRAFARPWSDTDPSRDLSGCGLHIRRQANGRVWRERLICTRSDIFRLWKSGTLWVVKSVIMVAVLRSLLHC
jgi:hypothetical protein